MFLLRCAFWLSIVYAAMIFGLPWQGAPRGAAAGAAVRLDGEPLTRVVAGVATACGGREMQCARDAVGLTALVRTAIAGETDATGPSARAPEQASDSPLDADAVPMPVPDPRRHARLTRRP